MLFSNKKSQAWGIDITVAIMIFSIGLLIFLIYSLNNSGEVKENFEDLSYQGDVIINTILSDGYPVDWNSTNVNKIGILTDGRINDTKLMNFYDKVKTNYSDTRIIFDTQYNYYFFMNTNMTIHGNSVSGFGDPTFDPKNIQVLNLIKIIRFSIYDNKPVTIYFYIWD